MVALTSSGTAWRKVDVYKRQGVIHHQGAIVAKGRGQQQRDDFVGRLRRENGRAICLQRQFVMPRPQPHHRHFVFGQRAGFITANNGHRPQRFHRRQAANQRVAPVSYTHLDVYKRQLLMEGRLSGHSIPYQACLLYTSRCV